MSLFVELKRRNVFRVAAAYAVIAWLLIEVSDTIFPRLGLPEWTVTFVIVLMLLGFPLALFFAWAYELTPEGLKRERDIDRDESITPQTGRKLDRVIIGVLVLAVSYFAIDKYLLSPEPPVAEPVAAQTGEIAPSTTLDAAVPDVRPDAAAQPEPYEHSIAVLPFVNMSDDAANEFFSDGIADELLNLLARIPELRVISRSSAFSFKGQNLEITQIAERLNVAHVLEGSVRKAGNRVRITAQLIDARADAHLWSETYDRTLDDVFAIQDEIAATVVSELRVTLLGEVPKVEETTPEAYALYLEGEHESRRFSVDSLARAVDLFNQALALDPGYTPAKAGLAVTYVNQAQAGSRPFHEGYAAARQVAEEILATDPDSARAHEMLAWIARIYDGDLRVAAHHTERALALSPGSGRTLSNASQTLWHLGRIEEAIASLERALLLDPLNVIVRNNLAMLYVVAGRLEEAIGLTQHILERSPDTLAVRYILGLALLERGDAETALAEFNRERSPEYRGLGRLAAYPALGLEEEAEQALSELIELRPQFEALYRASHFAWSGRPDEAFEWLGTFVESGAASSNVHRDFALKRLHGDPRWLQFLESIGQSPEQLAAIRLEVALPR